MLWLDQRAIVCNSLLATVLGVLFASQPAWADTSESAKDAHGAALTQVQLQALDALIPENPPVVPAKVDRAIWDALVPKDNQINPDRIVLGRKLFFETALSKDGTVSCATCHDVTRSFTDRRKTSEGVGGQLGKRNAPTTLNAALLHTQFLDGRAATLEEQAGQPILNPVEMGMADQKAALAALRKIPGYRQLFQKAYGRDINYDDLKRAIAVFERTMVFLDAPFDRYLAGEKDAISVEAQKGWVLFNGKARCASCHPLSFSNPLGTDNRFHNIGVSARTQHFELLAKQALKFLREDPSEKRLDELAVGTDLSELGRFMVTHNPADIGAFRTSQLRNVGITAPYMHDGSMETLWDTIDHYNKAGEANPYLDGGMDQLALSEQEIDELAAFLFSLTDIRFSKLNQQETQRQYELSRKARPFRDDGLSQRETLLFEQRMVEGGVR